MASTFDDFETASLARQVADLTGETPIEAIRASLRERLHLEQSKREKSLRLEEILTDIARRCAALPILDERSPDEIIGYDENGLPGRW